MVGSIVLTFAKLLPLVVESNALTFVRGYHDVSTHVTLSGAPSGGRTSSLPPHCSLKEGPFCLVHSNLGHKCDATISPKCV